MAITALLIDDEKRAVALLKKLLEETGEFSNIRYAFSANAALEIIKKMQPQLIFLDIQMPNKDGFALLKEIEALDIHPEIIFVTAFDQYSMKAVKSHAFDYLMKPVVREELMACIASFKNKKQNPEVNIRLGQFLADYESHKKIRFNTRTGFFQLEPVNIVYCQAEGNYTNIHSGEGGQLCTSTLGSVMELLPTNGFVRVGRSLIINSFYVYKVDRKANEVTFEKNGKLFTLSLSTRQIKELDTLI
jgi:two-component system, LytTR family, response regulator